MNKGSDRFRIVIPRRYFPAQVILVGVVTLSMLVSGLGCTKADGMDIDALRSEYLRYVPIGPAPWNLIEFAYVGSVTDCDRKRYHIVHTFAEWCTAAPPDCPEDWTWHGTRKLLVYDIQGEFIGDFYMDFQPRKFEVGKNDIIFIAEYDGREILLSFKEGFPKAFYDKETKRYSGFVAKKE